jgi:hypothetical protein
MINEKEHYVAWALLLMELDEAQEHLESLIKKMHQGGTIEDAEFAAELGHVYAHLNRVWHSRSQESEITEEQWPVFSQFPKDLNPVG